MSSFHCIESTVDIEVPFGTVRLWLDQKTTDVSLYDDGRVAQAVFKFVYEQGLTHHTDIRYVRNRIIDFLLEKFDHINALQIIHTAQNPKYRFGLMIYTRPFDD